MKKWYIYLTSIIIAVTSVGFFLSRSIRFTDEEIVLPTAAVSPAISPDAVYEKTAVPEAHVTIEPKVSAPDTSPTATPDAQPSSTPAVREPITVNTTPYLPVEELPTPEIVESGELPQISISDETRPGTVTINNVVNLSGIISTDSGQLTEVTAEISKDGVTVQNCRYSPFKSFFSLASTVNADLHFAQLSTGNYNYKLCASARNNTGTNTVTITDIPFSVVPAGSGNTDKSDSGNQIYAAQISPDNDNAAIIWNFLVSQFDNPYAAAGIMANMEAESSLNPSASQGSTPACGYGLCQWTQDRKARLNEFAVLAGTDVGDIDLQLCFLIYELDNYYPKLKQYLCDVGDGNLAASEFCAVYEQSASYGNRGKYVSKYLQRFALTQ